MQRGLFNVANSGCQLMCRRNADAGFFFLSLASVFCIGNFKRRFYVTGGFPFTETAESAAPFEKKDSVLHKHSAGSGVVHRR